MNDALAYAAAGWRVFPCRPDKSPYTPNGFRDASVDSDRVRGWWRQHPDAAIGAPTGEHFEVLDVDPRHGGDRNLAQLEARFGLPDGWKVETASGGHHHYFRPHPDAPNGANRFRHLLTGEPKVTGLDVKAKGGYVILPPSRTESGSYVWLRGPGGVELPDWPGWALTGAAEPGVDRVVEGTTRSAPNPPRWSASPVLYGTAEPTAKRSLRSCGR